MARTRRGSRRITPSFSTSSSTASKTAHPSAALPADRRVSSLRLPNIALRWRLTLALEMVARQRRLDDLSPLALRSVCRDPHAMNRRAFVTGLGAVLAVPLAAEAQQSRKVHRVVFLAVLAVPDLVDALRQGLRELGWTEGQNYVLEVRSAIAEKIPELAAELARTKADVIVVTATA